MASNASSTNLRVRIEVTVRAFLSAFVESGTQNDASLINRDVTPDCTRHLLPASVPNAFGLPVDFFLNTTKHEEIFAKDIRAFKYETTVVANLVIDIETRRAAFTSIADVKTNSGEVHSVETAWVLYFNEDGCRIKKVVEFGDKGVIVKMTNLAANPDL